MAIVNREGLGGLSADPAAAVRYISFHPFQVRVASNKSFLQLVA
jgi:hypothetical protein